ncbi:MAG: hypothetical protein ACKOOI_20480 [Pirellula sp.]
MTQWSLLQADILVWMTDLSSVGNRAASGDRDDEEGEPTIAPKRRSGAPTNQ